MIAPGWLLAMLTALALAVSVVSAGQLACRASRTTRNWHARPVSTLNVLRRLGAFDADAAQMLMAVSMLGMLVPRATVLPASAAQTLFVLLAVRFGWRCVEDMRAAGFRAVAAGHRVPHLVHCAATVYMLGAVSLGPVCSGNAGIRIPPILVIAVVLMAGYGIRDLLMACGAGEPTYTGARAAAACRAAMGAAMVMMLMAMR